MIFKEGYLDYPDHSRIRYRINQQNGRPCAVFLHGLGERLEFYEFLFSYFGRSGIALNMVELRGHGLSSGEPRQIDDFELCVRDVKRFIFGNLRNRPVYIIGHDAGGLVAARVVQDDRFQVKGLALSSPLLELRLNSLQRLGLSLAARLWPGYSFSLGEDVFEKLTRAEETAPLYREEAARSGSNITLGLLSALGREKLRLVRGMRGPQKRPLLLMLAEEDAFVHNPSVENYFRVLYHNSPALEIVKCRNCRHALLLERERFHFIEKIIKWIQSADARS